MNITLTVGDWSNDGHGQCDKYVLESNLNAKDIEKAFKKGSKIVGFDLTKLCGDYQDSAFPKENQDMLTKHIKLDTVKFPDGSKYDEEAELEEYLYAEIYAGFYLAIAKLGNPKLEAGFVDTGEEIQIGGYGLYS